MAERLRSEPTPSVSRSRRVMEVRAQAEQERVAFEADFLARLKQELRIDGSLVQETLIRSATSAAVEIAVISARFLRCTATSKEMERLGRARGELNRTLRLLHATPKPQDGTGATPGGTLAEYLACRAPDSEEVTDGRD